MSRRRGAGGGMTDADFRKLQLDYYKENPKSRALPFKDFLKEVRNEQAIREAVSSDRHKAPRSDRHRTSDLSRLDHHSHGSRSARPHVSPRMGAHSKHNIPSARGMGDHHGIPGQAFENEPLLPRQRGDLRGTGTHDRDGIFEDRRPSDRFGGHRERGRHVRQAEGLHQDTLAEDLGGMRLGDRGHHGHRSGPHPLGSRNGPLGDTHDESQFDSRGSRHGVREPPSREELPPRRGHHGGRSVHEADFQPLGSRRATPAPLSSRHQTASSRLQHSRTQGERHHTRHGDLGQHPGFQGSQGGRCGREDRFW